MFIRLELTEQQEHYLRQFAERQASGSDDNVGTRKPLHLVQTKETRIVWDGGMSGDAAFVCTADDNHTIYSTPEALVESLTGRDDIVSYDEAYRNGISDGEIICDEEDYFEAYGLEDCYKVSKTYEWRTVSIHFTLAEAKRYKKYQTHNLVEPRTYTVSGGYGNNGDYEPIWDLIMQAGQSVIVGGGTGTDDLSVLDNKHKAEEECSKKHGCPSYRLFRGIRELKAEDFFLEGDTVEYDEIAGMLSYHLSVKCNVDEILGTNVCTSDNSDIVEVYACVYPDYSDVNDTLHVTLWTGEDCTDGVYVLSDAEKNEILKLILPYEIDRLQKRLVEARRERLEVGDLLICKPAGLPETEHCVRGMVIAIDESRNVTISRALKHGAVVMSNLTMLETELLKYYEKVDVFNCYFKEENNESDF